MKVSLNTIRQFIDFELPPVDELIARINAQLGQVENVENLSEKYKDVVIVKVVSASKHPDADRLTVCVVDDGGVVADIERDENGYVQVVCGAPNVRAGMFAAWLPPRATVPSTYGTPESFVLDARELRGVKSNGMLAASDELALGEDHAGIIEIDPQQQRPYAGEIKPGASFAAIFGLNDTVIEIENKMFTHRPDLFGQLGIARELSAIIKGMPTKADDVADTRFVNPDWYWSKPMLDAGDGSLNLEVTHLAEDKVPRFMAVAMRDVTVAASPLWLQIELIRLGGKPINNIVDVTNYLMLLTAQPTHAYDYDKLRGGKLGVRTAQAGEKTSLLNGKTYELTADDIVIVDGEGIVGLGGVMGGGNSEVSESTKNIVLEVATFDMYTIRKTSMRHGLFTDAVTRFNKGQSPLQNDRVLFHLMDLVTQYAGGIQASSIADLPDRTGQLDDVSLSGEIEMTTAFVNSRLGIDLDAWQIGGLLRRANFASYPKENEPDTLLVTAPFWRTDIELREDIIEEVGRLYGFDALPRELPRRSGAPAPENGRHNFKQLACDILRRAGANEVRTYSFVHERILRNAGQDVSHAYTLSNALSPELQHYRLSVLPSLLDKVHMNVKAGFDTFAMFEIGKGHSKNLGMNDEQLPVEAEYLDLLITHKLAHDGAPYYRARHMVEFLANELHVDVVYMPIDEVRQEDVWAPFELSRSARIESRDGVYLGIVGELRGDVRARYKLPDDIAAASISIDALEALMDTAISQYHVLSRYPLITRDLSFRTPSELTYQELYHEVWQAAATYGTSFEVAIEPISIYQAPDDVTHKTTTFHIELTSSERTLKDEDANPVVETIARSLRDSLNAELI